MQLAEAAFKTGRDGLGLAAFSSYQRLNNQVPDNFISVEQLAAEALTRSRQWGRALALYQDLLRRSNEPAKIESLKQARNSAIQSQQLELVNLARSPAVTDGVSQAGIVKPKLKSLPSSDDGEQ